MGTEIKPDVLRGIAVPIPLVTVDAWEEDAAPLTDATQEGRNSGVPKVREGSSKFDDPALRLLTSGTPTDDSSLYVETHQAGLPGRDEAGFLLRAGQTASDLGRGLDAPGLVTGWEVLRNAAHPTDNRPHVIRAAGRQLLAIWERGAFAAQRAVYSPETSAWTQDSLTFDSGANGLAVAVAPHSSATDGERTYFYAGSSSVTTPNVEVWFSDDGPGGTLLRANPTALLTLPTSTNPTRVILSIRAAIAPSGQTLLLVWFNDGTNNDIAQ